MENSKRERCVNWETEEKQLFRNILKPYLPVIENKDLRTNSNKEKMKAWDEITEKFNLANIRVRDKRQLQNQWKCLKLNSKKELSSYPRETYKTGGGPKPPSPSPDAMEVIEMLPQEFEVDFNEFDCDGIMDITNDHSGKNVIIELEAKKQNNIHIVQNDKDTTRQIVLEDITHTTNNRNDKDITTKPLVEPIRQYPGTTPTSQRLNKKETRLRKEKEEPSLNFAEASFADMHEFRQLESDRHQKEHELRIKNMAEIHNQVMINLKLQEEILKQNLGV